MFGLDAIISSAMGAIEERNRLEAKWNAMPEHEREAAKEKYRAQIADDLAHRRALEVADAGRQRNWIETLFGR